MSKAEKPAAAADAPKKSKKMLIIIVAAVVLIGGGAAAFLLMKPHDSKKDKEAVEEVHAEVPAKYVELGTFTANLLHEEGDRYLQVAISLKLSKPELEEKIKGSNPEILHRVNMVLQSKSPSDLATGEGKERLAQDIKGQVEYVIGFRKTPPVMRPSVTHKSDAAGDETASEVKPAPHVEEKSSDAAAEGEHKSSGIADVLFTSFIIQ